MFSASLELILNVAYREAASRRHTHLTLEHLLYALAHEPEGERILSACGADLPALRRTLDEFLGTLETFSRGDRSHEPAQTLAFRRVLQTAVLHVQSAGKDEVRSGDVLAAIVQQPKSYAAEVLEAQGVTRLDILNYISHGISKVPRITGDTESPGAPAEAGAGEEGQASARDPLSAYSINLSARAREGKLDPLIGRTAELRRTLEILCRRRKNNPVFVGDAGVGKTALAEGLAARLLEDDVPAPLAGAEGFALDTTALLAGTRFRGDFEERFKAVIAALAERPLPILFIDEVHSTVGAGATTGGTMDLATLIKPVLAAGELRVIGSTTFDEFKHIEKDRALARRLQRVAIEEPTVDEASKILAGLQPRYAAHHKVTYSDDAVSAAATLAKRHLRDVRLPDSAIDVIDEAGAVLAMQRPANGEPDADEVPEVTASQVESVVARMARIPEKQATASDKERLRTLDESLQRVVFGQEEAVRAVVTSIKRSRAGLGQPDRPAGCFLFAGPTGVGKTELARQLALHLGSEFIRYDMSEYMEKHAVARLIGAPPGYVGFEQGGLLVDAVRTHPYAVVLLDEIEKAHADIFNILLQVMDHATLTDNGGRKADFRHAVLILTSNAGSREASAGSIGFGDDAGGAARGRMQAAIERIFSPEFRNRLDAIVTFGELSPAVMETIVEKFILQLETQLAERRVAITLDPDARAWLAAKGYDRKYGARPLARVVQSEVRNPLTDEILFGRLENGGTVRIGLRDDALTFDVDAASGNGTPEDAPPPKKDAPPPAPTRRKRRASEPAGPA
ncbi:MAG: AAA family ATPase [Acidobacteria bacterium]|nr:AAA family ATPase [Acidobacteriota bacterium]